ncbi:hypothetical protein COUCH_26590 [Couchioplanes caeruleus]|uniref:hypothetical protein n=1 Tax=Couchioplanes caeruleus TaxID=56438 RepID=UPI0020C09225|nr:hypothetical protein [Couchioplanes caeruleus]UQU62584.1 hypothetical protein COUCH_26590 [Couchioplanes caeruleus]
MSQQPTGTGLSDRLKQLQRQQEPLHQPAFGLDDVVRGGRRRRHRRTLAQAAAGIVAVAALATGIALPQLRSSTSTPSAVPPATSAAPAPILPAVDLANDTHLTYAQNGKTVTITKNGSPVATMTLLSFSSTSTSGHVVISTEAARRLTVDTALFVLYDTYGNENSASHTKKLALDTGTHSIDLTFVQTGNPEAVGWAPADGSATWVK